MGSEEQGRARGGRQDSPFRIASPLGESEGEREERGAEGCSVTAWEM